MTQQEKDDFIKFLKENLNPNKSYFLLRDGQYTYAFDTNVDLNSYPIAGISGSDEIFTFKEIIENDWIRPTDTLICTDDIIYINSSYEITFKK